MPGARYAAEKLVGFGILYLVVALAFLPSEIWRSSPIEGIWEVLTGTVAVLMTVISIGLLEVLTPLAKPLAHAAGMGVVSAATMLCPWSRGRQ